MSGNVYCGHCGARLSLTTSGKAYPCKADPTRVVKRIRYICYGKTRKQTECDGPTGYTAHILDGIIDKLIRRLFERMKAVPRSEIVNCLIKRVDVYRDYKLHVDFKIDLEQFNMAFDMEKVEIAVA